MKRFEVKTQSCVAFQTMFLLKKSDSKNYICHILKPPTVVLLHNFQRVEEVQ